MRQLKLAFALVAAMLVTVAGICAAVEVNPKLAADKVTVKLSAADNELRDYRASVAIKGSMVNPDTKQPMSIDSSMAFKLRHKYIKREGNGFFPMEISLLEGEVTMADQTLRISPSIYPKLTVLLDKEFRVDDILGYGNTAPGALPGINYGNMAMLFHVPGLNQTRSVGEIWESQVSLPHLKEAYTVKNTLLAVSKPGDVPATVTVRQDYTRVPMPKSTAPIPSMRATVESTFLQENGKMMKSHIDCLVIPVQPQVSDPKTAAPNHRATINMDVSLIK